jgi:hypothetical protein
MILAKLDYISFPVFDWECPQEALLLLSLRAEPSKIHSHREYGNENGDGVGTGALPLQSTTINSVLNKQ